MSEPAIRIRDLSKRFYLHHESNRSFQERFVTALRRRRPTTEEFWALRDVSLDIAGGETVGLIGPNGTGKSTLLKLIGRILLPTTGTIDVRGRVATLLELGAGFHPDLSGLDNIYLNGSLLGLTRRQITERLDPIIEFSELQRFIDTPVKHYSSGMQVRLGFAISVHVDPDILLVDEALAVGDEHFKAKCKVRFGELRAAGRTLVIVSHSMDQIRELCDRAVWMDKGYVRREGPPNDVIEEYLATARSAAGAR